MSRIIGAFRPIEANDVDCDECKHLKYESDTDIMICTSKSGCDRINKEGDNKK